jgi:polyhydroxybutyrate depolymerase
LPIDPARVYATGISNGGMMSYRLGCEASDTFAAIAPVSATLFTTAPCQPARRVSVLHIHGLADQNVPFDGGVGPNAAQPNPPAYPPVLDGVHRWARLDGCRVRLTPTTQGKVTTTDWAGCRDGTDVELITIADGGHSWPGGQRMAAILDAPSPALDATSTIIDFFAAHHR